MDFSAGVYLSEAQNPIPPLPPIQYTYSHREDGEGRRVEPERRFMGQQSQSWVENTSITFCIYSL
jgi:hypothetical protein